MLCTLRIYSFPFTSDSLSAHLHTQVSKHACVNVVDITDLEHEQEKKNAFINRKLICYNAALTAPTEAAILAASPVISAVCLTPFFNSLPILFSVLNFLDSELARRTVIASKRKKKNLKKFILLAYVSYICLESAQLNHANSKHGLGIYRRPQSLSTPSYQQLSTCASNALKKIKINSA